MKVIQLDSFEQIGDYTVQWNDLVERSKDNHIFLTLEWLATWWKHFGAKRELFLLAIIEHNRVLAVAPLMASTYKLVGVKLKKIEFIGTPSSDYQSFILIEKGSMCVKMILDHIKNRAATWDCMELRSIPENSETANSLRAISDQPLKLKERVLDICPFVPLPNTFEEYFQKLRRYTRRNLRRAIRALEREHRLEYKKYDEICSVEESMRIFFELHQKRWQSKGYSGVFANQTFRDFHLDVAKRFAENGWLLLCFLIVDDQAVSVKYAFEYRGKSYSYQTGFDPEYSKYGVMNLANMYSIKDAIEKGLDEFDFMRGGHSHKNRWNALTRRNIEMGAVQFRLIPKVYEWFRGSDMLRLLREKFLRNAVVRARTPVTLHQGRNQT